MPRKPWKDLTPEQRIGYLKVTSDGEARDKLARLRLFQVDRRLLPTTEFSEYRNN